MGHKCCRRNKREFKFSNNHTKSMMNVCQLCNQSITSQVVYQQKKKNCVMGLIVQSLFCTKKNPVINTCSTCQFKYGLSDVPNPDLKPNAVNEMTNQHLIPLPETKIIPNDRESLIKTEMYYNVDVQQEDQSHSMMELVEPTTSSSNDLPPPYRV
ncbi:hypothetical protein BC833DRAFT_600000 [Globomyces pollinis-pini]|nr:hypothetical protein BC833DRAFT_600000 [Globomyces pollinis-pini]